MENKLEKIADILVNYSIKLKPKETVILSLKDIEALPLFNVTYKKVLQKGAYPIVNIVPRDLDKIYFQFAKKDQLEYVSMGHEINIKSADAAISFSGLEPGNYLGKIDPKKMTIRMRATKKLNDYFDKNVRWVYLGYPTQAAIKESGLSSKKFFNLYFNAMIQDWEKNKKDLSRIKNIFDKASEIVILGEKTDLSFSLKERRGIVCAGNMNMPDGEIFYSPQDNSCEGEITFDFPVSFHGREIIGAYLKFKNGKVVKYSAKSGKKHLGEILKTDSGAKRIGEFGIGANKKINTYINNTLFDEKIGGTIHLALGKAYEESGGKNKSAIHFDMVKDLRKNGEIWADGKLVMKKGKFLFV